MLRFRAWSFVTCQKSQNQKYKHYRGYELAVHFAYPWNNPRSAIASPYLTYDQQHRRDRMFMGFAACAKGAFHCSQNACVLMFITAAVLEQKSGRSTSQMPFNQLLQKRHCHVLNWCKIRVRVIDSKVSVAVFGGHFDTDIMQYLASRMVNMLPDTTASLICRVPISTCWPLISLISFALNWLTLMTTG